MSSYGYSAARSWLASSGFPYIRFIFLPGCITPYGIFLKLWCALRFGVAVYYILTIPYNIATQQQRLGSYYPWLDVVLYVDLVIMAYVAYYDERSLLVTHPLLLVSRYLKGGFIWDALSVFPLERLFKAINENVNLDLCRVNRLLLVTRITEAFTYWESDIMKLNQAVVFLKFLPLAVTFVNFISAFIFMNTCKPYLSNTNTVMANCTSQMMVNVESYDTGYAAQQYLYTIFWVFKVFIGCGCMPMVLATPVNVTLVMALQVFGFLYFAFMFGYVASKRSAAAHALLEHTENTRDLQNFLYQENVDPILTAKTIKYFEYVWKRTNGSNPQQICRCLNSALMEDTLVFMYERALREVPLFGKVERSFIRVITQHLTEMYFLKGETVIQCRDVQSCIYIIYRGKVDVLSSYNEMLTCMGPGGMFGNFTGHVISSSEVSVYASRSLDLLVIPSQTFFNLVKYYPKIYEPLKKAFEVSRDYILPMSMDIADSSSSESDDDVMSLSGNESRGGSSAVMMSGDATISRGHMPMRSSQSFASQTKSNASVSTFQSYMHAANLLRPGTWLFQCFGYFTCLLVTLNYIILLYEIVTLNDCVFIFWLQTFFDIFFYIKMYLSIHQGYTNKRGELVTNYDKCRTRYFKHKRWICSDIFVNLPFEVFAYCFANPLGVVHYLRINKLFRLKYLIDFYRKTAAELTNNLTTLQLAMTIFAVTLLVHTLTCVWLLVLVHMSPLSLIRTLKIYLIDEDAPHSRWDYTTSIYVTIAESTTTGGDELVVEGILPIIVSTLSLICGKMLASIVVATSIQVAHSMRSVLDRYEEETRELIDMLKNQGLSSYQLKQFWEYVQQLWVSERGRQLPILLTQIPYVRRCDIMTAMFGHHLRNCYLFADTGEPFLRQLTVVLDYTVFFPGNYIVSAGDSEANMYFVASGTVAVVSVRADLTETTHELLSSGDVFGILQGLDRGIAHCFSYRAETKVSILTLSLDAWVNILPYFPEAMIIISERAEVLFAKI